MSGRSIVLIRFQTRGPPVVRVAVGPSTGRSGEGNGTVLTEEGRKGTSFSPIDLNDKSTVSTGGVEDVYVEDAATEDELVTPWSLSVAR